MKLSMGIQNLQTKSKSPKGYLVLGEVVEFIYAHFMGFHHVPHGFFEGVIHFGFGSTIPGDVYLW